MFTENTRQLIYYSAVTVPDYICLGLPLDAIKKQRLAERKREIGSDKVKLRQRGRDRDREVWRNQSPIMNSEKPPHESKIRMIMSGSLTDQLMNFAV